MTASIHSLLQPLKDRLAGITEGPWEPMRSGLYGMRVVHVEGEWEDLVPNEFITLVTPALRNHQDAEFIAAAPTDQAKLIAAIEKVAELHRPAKIYDECECPDGTHPDDYEYIDCEDYTGCHNSLSGIGCEECCVDGDYLSQACGESHTHDMDQSKRCPTVAALAQALGGDTA